MKNVSAAAKKAIYASQTGAAFFSILKIQHDTWAEDLCIVNNNEFISFDGDLYEPFSFSFKPPSETENGSNENAKVIIDNVDRTIVALMRSITTPATIDSAIVMVDESGNVTKEAGWWSFELRNISYNASRLSGDLIFNISLNDYISRMTYNNIDFPGMF